MRSSRRWITSVGTWIAGSTARTSMSRIIRDIRRNELGLIAIRSNRANASRIRAEPAVRQPGVPLVEHDQAAQRREPAEETGGLRVFPEQLEMAHQAGHEHDVPFAR